jgi:hypothetical protein
VSKEGAKKTQEFRKPRKRVELEERGDVIGKKCTDCGEWKALEFFHKDKYKSYGLKYHCKVCDYKRRKENEKSAVVKKCQHKYPYSEKSEEYKKRERERKRSWKKKNKQSVKVIRLNRRAKLKLLPNNLSVEEINMINSKFKDCCSISGVGDIHWDHILPISIGHGGTTFGNIIPLSAELNVSKNDSNIFEWFEANRQRFELSVNKFNRMVEFIATANALTAQEYREFYDWCFANPRTVEEIKTDQRHSIEIWREATGQQFPLPAYTETYYSSEVTESEAI